MSKQNLLCGGKINKLDLYEQCILGKVKKVNFETGMHVTKAPVEYVYSSFWGPTKTKTHGGKYLMLIIDDFSKRVRVFIFKNKPEAFHKFRD